MNDQDSKYRVALELAELIRRNEHPNSTGPVKGGREYWLRLYDQCYEIVNRGNMADVFEALKAKTQD